MRIPHTFAAFALLLASFIANAQSGDQVDVQSFKPGALGNGVLSTESGHALPEGAIDAGLWLHYQHNPLVYRDAEGQLSRVALGNQLTAELTGAYAVFDWLAMGVAVPTVLFQDGEGLVGGQAPSVFGLGDLRLTPRVRAYQTADGFFSVSALPQVTLPTGRLFDPYLGDPWPTFVPTVAASVKTEWVDAGLDASYLFRWNTTLASYSVRDEIGARLGAAVHVWPEHVDVLAEAYGATQAFRPFADPGQFRAELLGAVRFVLPMHLSATVGVGANPAQGVGTPDFRLITAVTYARGRAADKDGDGVGDDRDQCADVKEDADGFEDHDGCPDPDNDGDGVPDTDDQCPAQREDIDGFSDTDGCADTDNDGDGIVDASDACPEKPETVNGSDDTDGCPDAVKDADGDGRADPMDKCPTEPEDKDAFEDEDGCPDADNDQDGVADGSDKCMNTAGPVENVGCPDADRDGDTVVDRLDNCPDEPGTVDNKGCKTKQLVVLTKEKLEILDKVYFATGKTTIEKRSHPLLTNVAEVMKAHPEILRVRVEGHTDDVGEDAANKRLSQGRADAVRAFLIGAGVDAARLEAMGFGEEQPVLPNSTNKGRAANRRVEFKIVQ